MASCVEHGAVTLLVLMTVFVASTIVFMVGFFPISIARTNDDDLNILPNLTALTQSGGAPSAMVYNQSILMMVDALRYDFPTEQTMPFANQMACGKLQMRVNLPTVTMPRLKSLTTGTVSNFIDIVFNLGHEEQVENSILHGMRDNNYRTVFAGDRTWVQLFPNNIFVRQTANVDSFFVNDFYEGDVNVTRILNDELQRDDWHLLILHYLGLDHIGHVEGSESARIPLKLKEMDSSIRRIYDAKEFRHQLVLLTGDHGMRNGGGHGGATWEEMHVPLLYFKETCHKKSLKATEYNQIDVAPTLATLMGIGIPKNSIGCLIAELLDDLSLEEQLMAYALNARHLLNRIGHKYGAADATSSDFFNWLVQAQRHHVEFVREKRETQTESIVLMEQAKMAYVRASNEMSSRLSASLVNFDYELIALGITTAILVILNILTMLLHVAKEAQALHAQTRQIFFTSISGLLVYNILRFMHYIPAGSAIKCCLFIGGLIAIIFYLTKLLDTLAHWRSPATMSRLSLFLQQLSAFDLYLLACYAFTICSLASSSFIEFEERTWYYLGCSIFIQFVAQRCYASVRKQIAVAVVPINVERFFLNELTNIRHYCLIVAILATVARYSEFSWDETQLKILFNSGLILVAMQLRRISTSRAQFALSVLSLLCIPAIRNVNYVSHIDVLLYGFWFCIVAIALLSAKQPRSSVLWLRGIMTCLLIVAALLHKPQNILLIPAMFHTLDTAYKLCDLHIRRKDANDNGVMLLMKVLLTIFVGKIFYFCQGNTNSLATIDLNPGYIGQSSYKPLVVFACVTFNTYSAPFLVFLYLVVHLANTLNRSSIERALHLYTIGILLPAAVYICLLFSLRFHLFIYSVFAPKIFYEIFNVFIHYIALAVISCCLRMDLIYKKRL